MLRAILFPTILSFCITVKIHAQDSLWNPSTPILKTLLHLPKGNLAIMDATPNAVLKSKTLPFDGIRNTIIKADHKIFVNIQGSGELYSIDKVLHDSVLIKRIDKTIFYGYSFGAIVFEYNGNIYSFGGSGLWNINGQLRVFSVVKKEWDIIPLNSEIPSNSIAYFIDTKNGKLFYASPSYLKASINKQIQEDNWYVLDLNNHINTNLGSINKTILKQIHTPSSARGLFCYPLPEFNGSILTDHYDFFKFVDFSKLKMYEIKNKELIQALKATAIDVPDYVFSLDSSIYFSLAKAQKIDSIYKPGLIYDPLSTESIIDEAFLTNIPIIVGLAIFLLLIIALVLIKKKKIQIESPIESQEISFDPKEEELLEKIKEKMEIGLTIPEMNDLLGLTKKPLAIQKKNRNEVIQKINGKFKIINGTEEDLIIRKRDENDKRSFIYFLNETADVDSFKNQL